MTGARTVPARLIVWLRYIVIVAFVGGAVLAALRLPSITGAGSGSLGALVPKNAPALKAERVSVQRFGFPLLSQTLVVVRNPNGLPAGRQAQLLTLAERLSFGRVPGFSRIAGALPLVNTLGAAPFAREHGTSVLLYLFFRGGLDTYAQTMLARRLVAAEIGHRPGEFEGVTAEAPAQVTRTALINGNLKWVELATILLVAAAIAVHFRALGAALLTIVAVGVAYVLADRLVAKFGTSSGISIPAEVQPVLVVLVFGIVTDYSVFFLSRFRRLLEEGFGRREAAVRVVHQISPIVAVAGTTVAAGTAALLVAHLAFLRAFGPGLAIAVLIAMVVAVMLVPAALGVFGSVLYWPRRPAAAAAGAAEAAGAAGVSTAAGASTTAGASTVAGVRRPARTRRLAQRRVWAVRFAVRHPVIAVLLSTGLVLGAASGLLRIALGNELIVGLPPGSSVHRAYEQATEAFAPGVLAPMVVVVTGPGVGERQPSLVRLERLLAHQRDVAEAFGPADKLTTRPVGIFLSKDGNAARYALFLRTNPLDARAIADSRRLVDRLPALLHEAGLPRAHGLVAGDSALSADSVRDTIADLGRVAPTVLVAIFVVIAIFLRALVAPLYLVLTSALSALAALGLMVYVLQIGAGYGQITYYVLFVSSVLLVSLGSDYNVFLVGRIWQEGRRRPLREAIEVAGSGAARPITVAGFVLSLSFALLAIVPVRPFREIAFTVGVGLLIDAFVVRTILVPALMSLVGARSSWPGRVLKDAAGEVPAPS